MSEALDIIVNAHKEVSQLDFQNKELVNALLMSARRNVAMQLADASIEGFKGALDTMDKVKAIEDYIRVKRGQNLAELHTQNVVAAERLRIVRDIGKWLGRYLAHHDKRSVDSNPPTDRDEYWLDELGITKDQSSDWQLAARVKEEAFEKWLEKFLDTASERQDELYLNKFLQYIKPKSEKSEEKGFHQEIREYYRKLLCEVSEGNLSKNSFITEINDWKTTRDYVDKVMKEAGEMY